MTTPKAEGTTASATGLGARLGGAKGIATEAQGALTAGSRAYVDGVLELGQALGGFGREIVAEAGRHVRATVEARSLREIAEMQAAWVQHRVETSTAHAKEFADLAQAKTMEVIAPFAALLKRDKAA
ncbi:MAG: phasin family protein [Acetobacteraceae bacterium]|nr:phasin family protein [Acetobacteraceae bacterium]